jgi:hypothetical protein
LAQSTIAKAITAAVAKAIGLHMCTPFLFRLRPSSWLVKFSAGTAGNASGLLTVLNHAVRINRKLLGLVCPVRVFRRLHAAVANGCIPRGVATLV